MKLYLDTNIILGWFKRIMENRRIGREFETPSVIKFLSSHPNLELIVSNITEVEVFRYLISEWGCTLEYSRDMWNEFVDWSKIAYIEVGEIDFNEMAQICLKIPTKKRTLTNLYHLQVAKRYGFWFLTGESELKERYSNYYKKVLTYMELRQRLSSL